MLVVAAARRERLEGNASAEVRVFRYINDAHAALTELLNDSIVRDGATDHLRRNPNRIIRKQLWLNAKSTSGRRSRMSSAHSLAEARQIQEKKKESDEIKERGSPQTLREDSTSD